MDNLTQLGIIGGGGVSSEWRKLGRYLGQSTSELDSYSRESMLNNNTCCKRVFNHWINNDGHPPHYPLTWKGLYDVLCAIGHRGTAENMKETLLKS